MTSTALRSNAGDTRGRPFQAGNPGRPKGARNKASLAAEALLDGEAETLARKAVEMALAGDTTAMRLLRRDRLSRSRCLRLVQRRTLLKQHRR